MHAIESELIKVSKFKPAKKYANRQEYLRSLLNAANKLTDDDFENLSDELAAWCNAAIEAHNAKQELPDFDEVEDDEGGESPESEAEDDDEDGEASEGEDEDADVEDDDEDEPDDESDDEGEGSDYDPDEAEDDPSDDDEDDDADSEEVESDVDDDEPSEDEGEEPSEEPVKAKGKKPAAKKAAPKAAPKKPAKPEKAPAKKKAPPREEDVTLDKWGCMEGSKNSQALAMFEKGATTAEVKKAVGGTYYNLLKKMQDAGHRLEKQGALMTLVHKDAKRSAPKAPVKKGKK